MGSLKVVGVLEILEILEIAVVQLVEIVVERNLEETVDTAGKQSVVRL